MNDDNITYFDSSRVEYIPKGTKKFLGNKYTTVNIYRIQANVSMCGYLYFIY